jgi:Xaa-Pro aminopeptidase
MMLDLPELKLAGRADRVRARLAEQADALLVSSLDNVRWLTGFSGSNGWVVLTPDRLALVTDGRYGDQARRQMDAAGVEGDVLVGLSGAEIDAHIAAAVEGIGRVGIEADHMSHAE